MPRAEFQLFVNEDGSIEIFDPVNRNEAYADGATVVASEVCEMLNEAEML